MSKRHLYIGYKLNKEFYMNTRDLAIRLVEGVQKVASNIGSPSATAEAVEIFQGILDDSFATFNDNGDLNMIDEGDIILKDGGRLLGTDKVTGATHVLAMSKTYDLPDGTQFTQTELGSEHYRTNLNTDVLLTCDRPDGKKQIPLEDYTGD